jgi:hypothetical protein
MKKLLLLLVLLPFTDLYAQQESYNWWMYKRVGLDFGVINPTTGYPIQSPAVGGLRGPGEGVASLSTSNGQLLFYTNGDSVFSSNHKPMMNGGGLHGHPSTTQVVIVPDPRDNCRAYIFTADVQAGLVTGLSRCQGCLSYSIVDMSLNGGLGAVVTKNVVLHRPVTEKLTAIRHANGHDVWILAHEWNSNRFLAFLLTDNGVSTVPVVSSVGIVQGPVSPSSTTGAESTGAMKVSPDGSMIACMSREKGGLELFGFNNALGTVSSGIVFPNTPNDFRGAYIAEFSPDSRKLYVGSSMPNVAVGEFLQFDISSLNIMNIIASRVVIAPSVRSFGGLQLGPDGRIYTTLELPRVISVINDPNAAGSACNYDRTAIPIVLDPSELQAGTGIGTELITGLPQLIVAPISACPMAVPVRLLNFRADYKDPRVILSWTALEESCEYFSLEKSPDGLSFAPLETISCAGGSQDIKNHIVTDPAPFPGVTYYRLTVNGTQSLSRTVSLKTSSAPAFSVQHNPVTPGTAVSIRIFSQESESITVSIYNLFGELVYRQPEVTAGGDHILPGSDRLVPGHYIIECSSNGFLRREKLAVSSR